MNKRRLFIASCISLIATAMTFAIRGDILEALRGQFGLNNEQVGEVAGIAFLGFTISIFIGGPLCDAVGMGKLLALAFVCHVLGVLLMIFAPGYWVLWSGSLIGGLGNGLIEAAVNPLVATVYSDQKTEKLNALHVWFPGGIVIGGLVAYFMSQAQLSWQLKWATILIPTLIYGFMFLGQRFPATERVQSGVSTGDMFKEVLRPLFLLFAFCMLLTASTELGPNQWIPDVLNPAVGGLGIVVLVWINGLMAVGRYFAGPIVHRISPVGLLIGSSFFAAVGLFMLSSVQASGQSTVMAFVAATIFAIGVCFYWPTMLGITSERFPKGGAFLLALMGAIGNLAVFRILPIMGEIKDKYGAFTAFRYVAVLPVILMVIFGLIYLRDKATGGYKAVKLQSEA
jgi:MFS family permease